MTNVIIDTNLFFAALRTQQNRVRQILSREDLRFFAPNFLVVEIFKYKEEIVTKSKVSEDEVYELLTTLLNRISFVNDEAISLGNVIHAYRLCIDVDEKDTPFVALTLDLNGKYWTRDNRIKEGLQRKGFNQFFDEE